MSLKNISVVLPVYINKESNVTDTVKCISLLRQKTKLDFELVIVETCTQHFIDDCDIYIYEKEKTNPNKSINRAFRACSGDYVVFIGNDVFVDEGWLESLVECFQIKDCGLATLGNNEHGDIKSIEIKEEIYFSICMMKKENAWLDPFYTYIFDDTDLIFRIYTQGFKCYKNLNCIVTHNPHSTYGKYCGNKEEYARSKQYFMDKYSKYKDLELFKILTQ